MAVWKILSVGFVQETNKTLTAHILSTLYF